MKMGQQSLGILPTRNPSMQLNGAITNVYFIVDLHMTGNSDPCWDVWMHCGSTFPTPVFFCKMFPEYHKEVEHQMRTPIQCPL